MNLAGASGRRAHQSALALAAALLCLLASPPPAVATPHGPSPGHPAPTTGVATETADGARTIDRSWSAARRGAVEVEMALGTLRIVGTDDDAIELTGRIGADALLDVDRDGRWTRLRIVRPPNAEVGGRLDLAGDLVLRVPAASDVSVRAQQVELALEEVTGRLDLETVAGRVAVRGAPREIEAVSVSAPFELDVTTPRLRVRSVDGALQIAGAIEDLGADTVSGELTVTADIAQEARLVGMLGAIRVTGRLAATARLVARTASAPLEIHLPPATTPAGAAEVVVRSQRGRFADDAGPSFDATGPRGGPRTERYLRGETARRLELESFDGAIRILRTVSSRPTPSAAGTAESFSDGSALASEADSP